MHSDALSLFPLEPCVKNEAALAEKPSVISGLEAKGCTDESNEFLCVFARLGRRVEAVPEPTSAQQLSSSLPAADVNDPAP